MKVSFVIPTYNEAATIEHFLTALREALAGVDHEVIVVDDSSSDGTVQIVSSVAADWPSLRLHSRPGRFGVASAIVDGCTHASGPFIGTMNADLQHPASLIPEMLRRLEKGCDVVVASRFTEKRETGLDRRRTVVSMVAAGLARLILSRVRNVRDPMSGFFLFRKEAIDGWPLIPRGARSMSGVSIGFKFLVALIALGRYRTVCEVPYDASRRTKGASKFCLPDVCAYIYHLLYLLVQSGETSRIARFLVVGATSFAVYLATLSLLTNTAGLLYVYSVAGAWVLAFLSNFALNNALTFRDRTHSPDCAVPLRCMRFLAVKGVSFFLNLALVAGLTEIVGLYYMLSAVLAVAVVSTWNYLASSNFVWNVTSARAPLSNNTGLRRL